MNEFEEFKAELLEDPEVKKEYDALKSEYDIIKAMMLAREEQNLTHKA